MEQRIIISILQIITIKDLMIGFRKMAARKS